MSIALTVAVVVMTVALVVLVFAGLVRVCLRVKRRLPVPPRIWVALTVLLVYAAAGVLLLMTQGRGHRLLPLFTLAGALLGLVYSWLKQREARGSANRTEGDQGQRT